MQIGRLIQHRRAASCFEKSAQIDPGRPDTRAFLHVLGLRECAIIYSNNGKRKN